MAGSDEAMMRFAAKKCGLSRRNELVGAVVVGAFVYEVRHVPLKKGRAASPEQVIKLDGREAPGVCSLVRQW